MPELTPEREVERWSLGRLLNGGRVYVDARPAGAEWVADLSLVAPQGHSTAVYLGADETWRLAAHLLSLLGDDSKALLEGSDVLHAEIDRLRTLSERQATNIRALYNQRNDARAEVEQNQGACAVLAKNLVEAGAEVEWLTSESHVKVCGGKHAEAFLRDDSCPYCDAERLARALRMAWDDPAWANRAKPSCFEVAYAALRQHEERVA